MTTTTKPLRFINPTNNRVQILDPEGRAIFIFPFAESLGRNMRPDAVYVVEGAHWQRFSGSGGALAPFPRPAAYGLESFPDLRTQNEAGEHRGLSGSAMDPAEELAGSMLDLAARGGRFRAQGDVIRNGKRVVQDSVSGKVYMVEDTGAPAGSRGQMQRSVYDYFQDLGVSTAQDFRKLPDEALLAIPGVTSQAVRQLRVNAEAFFLRLEELGVTGGEVTASITEHRATTFADLLTDADDPEDMDSDSD